MIQIWWWLNQSGACRGSYFFVKMFAKKAGHISAKKRPDVKESRSQCSAWSEGRKLTGEVICGPLQSIRDAPIIYFTNFVVRCGCTVRGQRFRIVWVNCKCMKWIFSITYIIFQPKLLQILYFFVVVFCSFLHSLYVIKWIGGHP